MRARISPTRHLFLFGLAAVFLGSFSALGVLGFSMADENAGMLSRLHPSFYLTLPFLATSIYSRVINRRNFSLQSSSLTNLSFRAYCTTVFMALMLSLVGITNGSIMNTATTFLLPILCLFGISQLSSRNLTSIRNLIILIMLFNSTLGIIEKHFDYRLFTYMIGTEEKLNDPRPTAWFSHPLNNAVLTAIFLVYLIYSPHAKKLRPLRLPMILLHTYALTCFGGRTAVVCMGLIFALSYLTALSRTLLFNKGLSSLAIQTLILAIGTAAVLFAAQQGLFSDLLDRFKDDGGSAAVRWDSIALITSLSPTDVLFGYNNTRFDSTLNYYGVRTIEFSWLYILLKHGILMGSALLVSMCLIIYRLTKEAGRPAGYMAVVLIVVTFGYTSLASASLLIAQFVVMLAALQECNYSKAGTQA